ncbi:MAG: endonuclease/exonuclease/phosphatase family protein, partial [Rhizobiaceae bacterium]|nr:endonuclease/exonuclease/phosphatase family protein [Rhizobiaceae bacterium]
AIGGVAILSRRPFAEGREPQCFDRGSMAIAPVDFGGQTVEVTALHLGWPWPFGQNWQVRNVSPILAELNGPALLAGDFNATPWSQTAHAVAAAGGLAPLPVPGATWLYHRLPQWLHFTGLPIDQVMAKGEIDIHAVRTLDPVGSDHLPVLVEFSLPPKPAEDEPQATTAFLR